MRGRVSMYLIGGRGLCWIFSVFFLKLDLLFSLCSHQVLRRFLTFSQSLQMYSPNTWFCTILHLHVQGLTFTFITCLQPCTHTTLQMLYHAPLSCLPSLSYGHQISPPPPPLIWLQFTLKEFLIGSKGIFEEQSGNSVSNHEHTSVGWVFVFLYDSHVQGFWNTSIQTCQVSNNVSQSRIFAKFLKVWQTI
jgi:hypothetical protein